MKIGLYNLVSEVHNEEYIDSTLQDFLEDIEERLDEKFEKINLEDFSRKDYFSLIFIKSGGVEGKFKHIGMDELVKEIERDHNFNHRKLNDIKNKGFDSKSIEGALKIYNGFKAIVNKYKLDGITVRCFDLLEIYKNTGCLGLALLNDEGIMGGCEGDIPALVSMVILHYLTDEPIFMANPASIDINKKEIILAHCTLPLNMPDEFYLKTHFESGLGVGIQGVIEEGEAAIFKLSGDGKKYFVSGGEIIENLNKESLCRTQIRMKVNEDIKYFLQNSLANHHLICKGDNSKLVNEFFKW